MSMDIGSLAPKIQSRLKAMENGCWEYQGYRAKRYGVFRHRGGNALAHRIMYAAVHGPIPDGQVVCHRCDNPPCCNPEHLFLGTIADNNRDMIRKGRGNHQKKTCCINGHEFTTANTLVAMDGTRHCRICRRKRNAAYKKRLRMCKEKS